MSNKPAKAGGRWIFAPGLYIVNRDARTWTLIHHGRVILYGTLYECRKRAVRLSR